MFGKWSWVIAVAAVLGACAEAAPTPPAAANDIAGVPDSGAASATTSAALPSADPSSAAAAPSSDVDAATAAARSWLALIDDEKYADSWHAAADAFQGAVTADDWAKAVGGVRKPLGKLVSRQVDAAEFKTSLPGAPDGKYVVVRFKTVFENKAQAIETVTPSRAVDGTWKVSGYFVR